MTETPLRIALAVAVIVGALVAAVALPLATYTLALALFGLAHVGAELRFVDLRFAGRLAPVMPRLAVLLAAGVAARLAGLSGVVPASIAAGAELLCGAGLVAASLPLLARRRVVAAGLGLALVAGAVAAPAVTLLGFAVLHNLTPVALVGEAVPRAARPRVLVALAVVFFALPALIASGLPAEALARLGALAPDATLLAVGTLDDHLGVYVPPALAARDWAVDAFCAAVFAQCLHYATVLHVLPRLLPAEARRGCLRWPSPPVFLAGLTVAALVLFALFVRDFARARRLYGLAALVHAWIEVPVLLVMLGGSAERGAEEAEPGRGGVGHRRQDEAA